MGFILAGVYVAISTILILSQGLFGESFIAILLGFPWSFMLAFIEFGNVSGAGLYILVLAPLVLNTMIFYGVGTTLDRK